MTCLHTLIAAGCEIKELELDKNYFPNLHTIDLSDNNIETYYDIKSLENIESLRVIKIYNNPILKTGEIFIAEKFLKKAFGTLSGGIYKLEVKYNPEVRSRFNGDFDELSLETQKGLEKLCYLYEEESKKFKIYFLFN